MNRIRNLIRAASLLVCFSSATAAELTLPRDGWTSWDIEVVDDAPAWCCRGKDVARNQSCKLDEANVGYGTCDGETTSAMRIYARFHDGELERLHALSADCAIELREALSPQGAIDAETSARWIASVLARDTGEGALTRRLRNDTMAALAVHRGGIAHDALVNIARTEKRFEQRKDAVFWLAHVRGTEGAAVATQIMFDDANPRMREHAAFAVSQSKSPTISPDLIRLASTDGNAQVRSQAWFWLAQSESEETEAAIGAALKKEKEQRVREQAIFALSQLPETRAASALIAVAEDKSLDRADRKQAVFWLAQEGSDSAVAYLDKIISREK